MATQVPLKAWTDFRDAVRVLLDAGVSGVTINEGLGLAIQEWVNQLAEAHQPHSGR